MIIEDTVGRQVTIKDSSANGTTTQTIIMPDESEIKIVYKEIDCAEYRKTELSTITDAENNTTSFVYEISENDNYKNALIKEMR